MLLLNLIKHFKRAATSRLAKGHVYIYIETLHMIHRCPISMVPADEEADAAAVAAAEEHLQCPVCYDIPEGTVNQVRRARLLPCPASLSICRIRPRRTCRSA